MATLPTQATDVIGRSTSEAARSIHDAKGEAPTNLASNLETAKRASKHVGEFISRVESTRVGWVDKLTVFYALWNGKSVADYFPSARHVHVPEAYKAVEGFVPRIASILVEQPDWFRVVGRDDAGKKNAPTIQKLLKAQLKDDGFDLKVRDFLRGSAIYGQLPGKCYWKKRRRKIKYNKVLREPLEDGSGEKVTLKRGVETEINLDGPTLETTDVFDFFVDPRYKDHQDSPGVAWRMERFAHELSVDKNQYVNLDALLKPGPQKSDKNVSGPLGTYGNPAGFQDLRNASDGIGLDLGQDKDGPLKYDVIEWWGLFNPTFDEKSQTWQGEDKEYQITLARRKGPPNHTTGWTCLKVVENPWWHGMRPAVVAHFTRRPHAFPSVGMIEPIVSLCAELDDSRQMALAARALAAKPMVVANGDAEIYGQNLVIEPGSIIYTRGDVKNSIAPFFMPDRSDSAYRAEAEIKNDIREVTGIISTYQGTSDAASETATSIVNRTREANKRITEVAKNIANGFLVPTLNMWHSMNQQMLTKERTVELIGADGLTVDIDKISPEDVAGQVGFEITALPEIEIAGLKSRMINAFIDRSVAIEQIRPGTTNLDQLMKMSWASEFGQANLEKVFPNANAPLNYRTAMDEHYVMSMGSEIDVQDGENSREHLARHQEFTSGPVFRTKWDEDSKRRLFAHIKTTEARLQVEADAEAPRTDQAAALQQQQLLPQQRPQQGAPQAPGPQQGGGIPPQGGLGPVSQTGQVRSQAASAAPRTPSEE